MPFTLGSGSSVTTAVQEEVVPPFVPEHTQSQELPFFATVDTVPSVQRLVEGAVRKD